MSKYGFKELTIENWMQRDETSSLFVRVLPDGNSQPITGDDWLPDILAPKLTEEVPPEVQALFEVARGTFVYGYFFYPLYALGLEQVTRVAEAAITYKCKIMGTPRSVKTFQNKIDFLIEQKVISKEQKTTWDAIRGFRNEASHPTRQNIIFPTWIVTIYHRTAQVINDLFPMSQ